MIDRFKVKLGKALPGYRFNPGECVVNSHWADEFRQGRCTQEDFDGLKALVVEVGIDEKKGIESYRLLYYSPIKGGTDLPWEEMAQWFVKSYVDSNFELCEHPAK